MRRARPSKRWRLEFETAVAEIAANIIEHANPAARGDFSMHLFYSGESVSARFVDSGLPFTHTITAPPPADPLAETGRGIAIARAALDRLHYQRQDNRNVWTLEKRLRR